MARTVRGGPGYDYVICGGGTAGAVLAGRLSEDPACSVLLLEAGRTDRHPLIHVPAGFAGLHGPHWSWSYLSVPQRGCLGRRIPMVQARVIGGGGSVNAQVCVRGSLRDYDVWESEYGAKGWSGADVLPYFVRAEGNRRLGAPLHGTDGPITVSDPQDPHPLSRAWVEAGRELGLPGNDDFNGASMLGTGLYQTTTRDGRRCSAATGYLRPARRRPNLTVLTHATVTRVLLEADRAVGVEYVARGRLHQVSATTEVLLTSGGIGSPTLLLRSGIGDATDLRQAGAEVRHHLPGVGRNLQDHLDVDLVYELREQQSLDRLRRPGPASIAALGRYAVARTGPLASTVVEAGAFTRLGPAAGPTEGTTERLTGGLTGLVTGGDPDLADLQFHFLPAAGAEVGQARLRPGYGLTVNSYLLRPVSRGSVRLSSPDPGRLPVVDPAFLEHPADVTGSADGVRQTLEIMAQPAIARHVRRETRGAEELRTPADLARFARAYGRSAYHASGTCAMGTGPEAVVAPDLRVHGLEGLRVVDSSVMPQVVSGNTQMPTVMIAEKGADLVTDR